MKTFSLGPFKVGDEYKKCRHYEHYEVVGYNLVRYTKCGVLIYILLPTFLRQKEEE